MMGPKEQRRAGSQDHATQSPKQTKTTSNITKLSEQEWLFVTIQSQRNCEMKKDKDKQKLRFKTW